MSMNVSNSSGAETLHTSWGGQLESKGVKETSAEKIRDIVEGAPKQMIDRNELEEKVDGMNKMLDPDYTSLKFNVHEKLERVYVQVMNRDTEEIIREVPPEEFLDMVASMLEQVGLIVDEKV